MRGWGAALQKEIWADDKLNVSQQWVPAAKRFFMDSMVSHGTGFPGKWSWHQPVRVQGMSGWWSFSYGSVLDSPERSKELDSKVFMSPFASEIFYEIALRFCVSAGTSRTTDPICETGSNWELEVEIRTWLTDTPNWKSKLQDWFQFQTFNNFHLTL